MQNGLHFPYVLQYPLLIDANYLKMKFAAAKKNSNAETGG